MTTCGTEVRRLARVFATMRRLACIIVNAAHSHTSEKEHDLESGSTWASLGLSEDICVFLNLSGPLRTSLDLSGPRDPLSTQCFAMLAIMTKDPSREPCTSFTKPMMAIHMSTPAEHVMYCLPVPAASLASDVDQPLAKRAKINQLPCAFFCITAENCNPQIDGLFHVTAVHEYFDSRHTTPQYLNLIAENGEVDKSDYVVWSIDSVVPLSVPFRLPRDSSMVSDLRRHTVLKGLTNKGYQQLLQSHVYIGGTKLFLSEFVPRAGQIRCFRMSSHSWQSIMRGLQSMVTSRAVLYHAGLPASDLQPPSQGSASGVFVAHADADSQAQHSASGSIQDVDSDEGDADQQDSLPDRQRHSLDTILSCMRLSVLLRNASNIREAIDASLVAFKSAAKVKGLWLSHVVWLAFHWLQSHWISSYFQ